METVSLYLLRSAVWITAIALVYRAFLSNERFFLLNRIYLVSGILASLVLPLVTIRYVVELPIQQVAVTTGAVAAGSAAAGEIGGAAGVGHLIKTVLLAVWLSGVLFLLIRHALQAVTVFRALRRGERLQGHPVSVLLSPDFSGSFSWFSLVVINPSLAEREVREIINHEMVHVRQKHWVDLLLSSFLCMVQWFNPAAWACSRFIRQNHEYLADKEALMRSADPAFYRAVLLNQIAGSPLIETGSYFSHSLNKKRFIMMKNKISSPYRKLRLLLILPVAALVLYAFAEPRYEFIAGEAAENTLWSVTGAPGDITDGQAAANGEARSVIRDNQPDRRIRGVVTDEHGRSLTGAIIVIRGTTTGTATDAAGRFTLEGVSPDARLVVSHVGYEVQTLEVKTISNNIKVRMHPEVLITPVVTVTPPPPPGSRMSDALLVVDGKVSDLAVDEISPSEIAQITVLKGETAIAKYGERGGNGVIEIITVAAAGQPESVKVVTGYPIDEVAAPAQQEEGIAVKVVTGYPIDEVAAPAQQEEELFVVVEELPRFPGGDQARDAWIMRNIRYPKQAALNGIAGEVHVSFVVGIGGKISDISVVRSVDPLLDAEAVRVLEAMPDWKPGTQRGQPVVVKVVIPVKFSLQ